MLPYSGPRALHRSAGKVRAGYRIACIACLYDETFVARNHSRARNRRGTIVVEGAIIAAIGSARKSARAHEKSARRRPAVASRLMSLTTVLEVQPGTGRRSNVPSRHTNPS